MTREIEVPFHGPVASAIADAVADALQDRGLDDLIQSVEGDNHEQSVEVTYTVLDHRRVLSAAYEALCEHHPDEIESEAETEVTGLDFAVEDVCTVTISEGYEDDGGDD